MKAAKNRVPELIEKEVKDESISFLDRRQLHWFIDSTNVLKLSSSISDFLNGKAEEFAITKIHLCEVKYWKIAETADGKFVLLSRTKLLK